MKRYTPEEETVIRNLVGKYRIKRIAAFLGRDEACMSLKIRSMGLDTSGETIYSVAKKLGMHRQVLTRIANKVLVIERGKYLTPEQVRALVKAVIDGEYKCNLNPDGRDNGRQPKGRKKYKFSCRGQSNSKPETRRLRWADDNV